METQISLTSQDLWHKLYHYANSIQQTSDGGYILAGITNSFGTRNHDAWVLNLNANGEIPNCIVVDTSDATVSDTSAGAGDTTVIPQESSSVPADTAVSPQNTLAETNVVCLGDEALTISSTSPVVREG